MKQRVITDGRGLYDKNRKHQARLFNVVRIAMLDEIDMGKGFKQETNMWQ